MGRRKKKTITAGDDGSAGFAVPADTVDDELKKNTAGIGEEFDEATVKEPDSPLEGDLQSDDLEEGEIIKVPGATLAVEKEIEPHPPGMKVLFKNQVGIITDFVAVGGATHYHYSLKFTKADGAMAGFAIAAHSDVQPIGIPGIKAATRSEVTIKALLNLHSLNAALKRIEEDAANGSETIYADVKGAIEIATQVLQSGTLSTRNRRAIDMARYALGASRQFMDAGDSDSRLALAKAAGYIDAIIGEE